MRNHKCGFSRRTRSMATGPSEIIACGGLEEVATSGSTTTTTVYYYAGGKRIALSVNGTVSYLASDGLGSANVTLNGSGTATASQLYAPYGGVRYSSGTMPTSYGFTGQRADTASGLDYYGARYYDPLAGQFTSADSVVPVSGFDLWGLSRYAYVEGNPENRTDPTGHINLSVGDDGSAVPIDNAFQGTYSWGSSPVVTYHRGFTHAYPAARSRYQRLSPPKRTPAPRPRTAPAAESLAAASEPHPMPSLAEASNTPLPGRIGEIPNSEHWTTMIRHSRPDPGGSGAEGQGQFLVMTRVGG
jgi:RHS repeat-associated protein